MFGRTRRRLVKMEAEIERLNREVMELKEAATIFVGIGPPSSFWRGSNYRCSSILLALLDELGYGMVGVPEQPTTFRLEKAKKEGK